MSGKKVMVQPIVSLVIDLSLGSCASPELFLCLLHRRDGV